jgi:hypothetical protein
VAATRHPSATAGVCQAADVRPCTTSTLALYIAAVTSRSVGPVGCWRYSPRGPPKFHVAGLNILAINVPHAGDQVQTAVDATCRPEDVTITDVGLLVPKGTSKGRFPFLETLSTRINGSDPVLPATGKHRSMGLHALVCHVRAWASGVPATSQSTAVPAGLLRCAPRAAHKAAVPIREFGKGQFICISTCMPAASIG